MQTNAPLMVALDGSPFAEMALPLATLLARRADAPLLLALVHEPTLHVAPGDVAFGAAVAYSQQREDAVHMEQLAYLECVAERLRDGGALDVTTQLLDGSPSEALLRTAAEREVRLLVLTTHGRGRVARAWLGSVADRVVRSATVPTLLIRPHEHEHQHAEPAIHQLLISLDGSPAAEAILTPAREMCQLLGVPALLMQVVDTGLLAPGGLSSLLVGEQIEARRAAAAAYLERTAAQLRDAGLDVTTEVVLAPHVAQTLLECAQHTGMLALTTVGRSGVMERLLGSTADKLIRAAEVPLLLCRPTRV